MQKISISAAIRQATANHGPVARQGRHGYSYIRRAGRGAPWCEALPRADRRAVQAYRRASIAADAAELLGLPDAYLAWVHALDGATIREALDYLTARDALEQLRKAAHPLDVDPARCTIGPRRLPAYTVSGHPGVFTAEGVYQIARGINPGRMGCTIST